MLEQPRSLLLHQLGNHVAQDGADGVEALVGGADVVEAVVVEQDLLDDEDGDGFAELRPRLHDAEAEGDDLGGEEEVYDFGRVVLNQGPDHSERRQAEVLEGTRLRRRVEEWIEVEGDVRWRSGQALARSFPTTACLRAAGVPHRSKTACASRCVRRRTGGGPAHCRRGSRRQRSTATGSRGCRH